LCDVAPDGSSTLITRGAINLTHRNGFDVAEDLVPGEFVDAEVSCVAISYRVPPGHRLRLALSSSYWPWLWPHPEDGALTIDPAGSVLHLEELNAAVLDRDPVRFAGPEQAAPLALEPGPPLEPRPERLVSYEPETQRWRVDVDPNYGGNRVYPDGLSYGEDAREHYLIERNDPLSAEAGSAWTITLERGDWSVRIETSLTLTGTATDFVQSAHIRTFLNGEPFFEREYRAALPRTSA
ncbi:CocE/NonD family hydrolase C-terminal non-catalytic domain-containing protein, partial [Leucobacter sp. M11]|uniref:CocE/NonD family hydrolase C-terminal non-catalytic domain-containing protein n=1 Tax=Leucobacter sp. M11 TaxID=2993565 RepID=UPI002D80D931